MRRDISSNASVILAIAEEAIAESQRLLKEGRHPKANGESGWVNTLDPQRRSFKHALIAIACAGIHFEAVLRIVGREVIGPDEYAGIEHSVNYEG